MTVVVPFPSDHWHGALLRTTKGEIRPILANAVTALRSAPEWQGVLAFDEFACQTVALEPSPWAPSISAWEPVPWTDLDDINAAEWFQRIGILIGPEVAAQAVQTVAAEHAFHPVRDFLRGLRWDGKPRLDGMLATYFGAADNVYTRSVGAKTLIAAVARVMRPGAKVDSVLILVGSQGAGKSTALGVLGGKWFTDELGELGSKDAAMQSRSAWIIEVAELDGMSRAEVVRVKAFFSRSTDRFRPPYGRRVVEMPRQCVFIGSTNAESFLKDETGARRFWPVACGTINVSAVRRDRGQLWAEALARFNQGETWWLTDKAALHAAEQAQDERYVGDVWEDRIAAYVATNDTVSVATILTEVMAMELGRAGQAEANRVQRVLVRMGLERFQKRKADGTREWRYRKPDGLVTKSACHHSLEGIDR
jgi:predicted P-loop ATPase